MYLFHGILNLDLHKPFLVASSCPAASYLGTKTLVGLSVGLSDLADKNMGLTIKCEFQTSEKFSKYKVDPTVAGDIPILRNHLLII